MDVATLILNVAFFTIVWGILIGVFGKHYLDIRQYWLPDATSQEIDPWAATGKGTKIEISKFAQFDEAYAKIAEQIKAAIAE